MDEELWFIQNLARVRLHGERTEGRFSVVEMAGPAGDGPPLHRHDREDEAFYVLDGRIRFWVGATTVECAAGQLALGQRGVPHTFRVSETGPARWLVITAPAGFEAFVERFGVPAAEPGRVPPARPPDIERLTAIGAEFGVEILGPPGMLPDGRMLPPPPPR